jgi:hypothetical protein
MSTLLQCILNQNPNIAATPTDPVLEYLYGARINYSSVPEVKAIDKDLSLKAWRGFCWGGLKGYTEAYSPKEHICIKTRGGTIHYKWFEAFMPYKPKMICMVRNLKSVFSSMEKIFRKNQESHQPIQDHSKMFGTTTAKRIDAWIAGQPIGLALERVNQIFLENINKEVLFIRAEDLTSYPDREMKKIYNYLELDYFEHNFQNVEQTIKEDDSVYNLTSDLHVIKNKVQPLKSDYNEILGSQICQWIDGNFSWYQKTFGYIN